MIEDGPPGVTEGEAGESGDVRDMLGGVGRPAGDGAGCPQCGSDDLAEIRDGLPAHPPDPDAVLGSVVEPGSPRWQCRSCGAQWGSRRVVGPTDEKRPR